MLKKRQEEDSKDHQEGNLKKQKMADDNLIPFFEKHGIMFSTILATCTKNANIMTRFFATNDSALLFFYFLANPPPNYEGKADDIVFKVYQEVPCEKRCLNIITVLYECACNNIEHDALPPTLSNIYEKEIVNYLPFNIWGVKDIKTIPLNCILLCFSMSMSRIKLSHLEYLYDQWGVDEFNHTFLMYSSLLHTEPFLVSVYYLPCLLSNVHTTKSQFDFLISKVNPTTLCRVCAAEFTHRSATILDSTRLRAILDCQESTQNLTNLFLSICNDELKKSYFFFIWKGGMTFLNEVGILKEFLFYNDANPAYVILSKEERRAWEFVKNAMSEKILLEEFRKHEKFYTFYMDANFFIKLIETLPIKKKRIYLAKSYAAFFDECILENDLTSARWAWDIKISTPSMRKKIWDNRKFLKHCNDQNNEETAELFIMMYGNGYMDKKKEEEVYLKLNMQMALDYAFINNTNMNQLLIFQKLSTNENFLHTLKEVIDIPISRNDSPSLFHRAAFLQYLKTYISERMKTTEWQKFTVKQCQLIQTTFDILLENHRTRNINNELYEYYMNCYIQILRNEKMKPILNINTYIMKCIVEKHHVEIFWAMMDDPTIKYCFEEHHYFNKKFDVRSITEDEESAVRALNEYEQNAYGAVVMKYDADVRKIGVDNVLELIRARLREEFEAENTIPFDCSNAPSLTPYFKNVHHTAWRFLASPNPLVDNTSEYLIDGGSYYDSYKDLIALYYLAAIDKHEPCIENFTTAENREQYFFAELAGINRAHNLDAGTTDDLERDKPSCYSGIKKRIINSVPGNALSTVLQVESLIDHVLDEEIPRIFEKKWAALNHEPFVQCFDRFAINATVTGEMYFHLEQMNLTNDEQNALFLKVLKKIDNMQEIIKLRDRFTPQPGKRCSENLHVITFYKYFISLLN